MYDTFTIMYFMNLSIKLFYYYLVIIAFNIISLMFYFLIYHHYLCNCLNISETICCVSELFSVQSF